MGLGAAFMLGGAAQGLNQGVGEMIARQNWLKQFALEQQRAQDEHNTASLAYQEALKQQPYSLPVFKREHGIPDILDPTTTAPTAQVTPDAAPAAGSAESDPSNPFAMTAPTSVVQPGASLGSLGASLAGGSQAPQPQAQGIGAMLGSGGPQQGSQPQAPRMITPPLSTGSSGPKAPPPGAVGNIVAATSKGQGVTSQMITSPTLSYGGVPMINPMGLTYSTLTSMGMDPKAATLMAVNPTAADKVRYDAQGNPTIGARPLEGELIQQYTTNWLNGDPAKGIAAHPGDFDGANDFAQKMVGKYNAMENPTVYEKVHRGLIDEAGSQAMDRTQYRTDHPGAGSAGSPLHQVSIARGAGGAADNAIAVYGTAQAASQDPAVAQQFTRLGIPPEEQGLYLRQAEARARSKSTANLGRETLSYMGATGAPVDSAQSLVGRLNQRPQISLPAPIVPAGADPQKYKTDPQYKAWVDAQTKPK